MPIYEYFCDGCQFRFEVKQKVSDAPVSTCERCGSPVRKLISSPAIMFKGSGWYVTDYSDKLKPPAQAEGGAPPGNGKKDAATPPAGSTASSTTSPGPTDGAAASTGMTGTGPSASSPSTPPSSS